MKQLIAVVSFFTILNISAQDSLRIHNQFYIRQKTAMTILGSWSIANMTVSPLLRNQLMEAGEPKSSMEYFHEINFYWNVVNLGISGLGYVGIQKRKKQYWSLSNLEKERNKLRKTLAINMGLDVCYLLAGAMLRNRAEKMSSENQGRNIGFGNSLILQGGFLLVFDGVFVIRMKQ